MVWYETDLATMVPKEWHVSVHYTCNGFHIKTRTYRQHDNCYTCVFTYSGFGTRIVVTIVRNYSRNNQRIKGGSRERRTLPEKSVSFLGIKWLPCVCKVNENSILPIAECVFSHPANSHAIARATASEIKIEIESHKYYWWEGPVWGTPKGNTPFGTQYDYTTMTHYEP